jgi:hypothetical protein
LDPERGIFVRTANNVKGSVPSTGGKFTFWDLTTAGPNNRNVVFTPQDPSGEFPLVENGLYGLAFDPLRQRFVLWNGDPEVWFLEAPEPLGRDGWILTKALPPVGSELPSRSKPGDAFRGVLGKWSYVPGHDVFIGVIDHIDGDVWVYKPVGWQPGAGKAGRLAAGRRQSLRPRPPAAEGDEKEPT